MLSVSDYNLIILKVFLLYLYFYIFYDKHVYLFKNECADSSEPQ